MKAPGFFIYFLAIAGLLLVQVPDVKGQGKTDTVKLKKGCAGQKFEGLVDCRGNDLSNAQFFSNTFNGPVSFQGTHFAGSTYVQSYFNNKADFSGAVFDGIANFSANSFDSTVTFANDSFYGDVIFNQSNFFAFANFRMCSFMAKVYFNEIWAPNRSLGYSRCEFFDEVSFNNSKFGKNIFFDSSVVMKNVIFDGTRFGKRASFAFLDMSPKCNLIFRNAILPDTLNFSYNLKIPNEIDLHSADFTDSSRYDALSDAYKQGKYHYIYLYKTDIAQMHLDYLHFRVIFVDPVTRRKLVADEIASIYEALLNNFKSRGQTDSYELLDIEYHDYQWSRKKYISWFGTVPHYWNAYGYKKESVFKWALVFLCIFTLINSFCLRYLVENVYQVKPVKLEEENESWPSLLWKSFVYTSSIFFLVKLNFDEIKYESKLAVIYLLTIYLSGLLCLAYMANFVLQK